MNIKTQFIFKLITKYFIYGYLCIFGISVCLCISYIVYTNFKVPEKYKLRYLVNTKFSQV